MKLFVVAILLFAFSSCFYPRVSVSRFEKKQIQLHEDEALVFAREDGVRDTIIIVRNHPRKRNYYSNIDHYFGANPDQKIKKREFVRNYLFENKMGENRINIASNYSSMCYYKDPENDHLRLRMANFNGDYSLSGSTGDTIVFTYKYSSTKNSARLGTIYLPQKIIYSINSGIVEIITGNNKIWKRE